MLNQQNALDSYSRVKSLFSTRGGMSQGLSQNCSHLYINAGVQFARLVILLANLTEHDVPHGRARAVIHNSQRRAPISFRTGMNQLNISREVGQLFRASTPAAQRLHLIQEQDGPPRRKNEQPACLPSSRVFNNTNVSKIFPYSRWEKTTDFCVGARRNQSTKIIQQRKWCCCTEQEGNLYVHASIMSVELPLIYLVKS